MRKRPSTVDAIRLKMMKSLKAAREAFRQDYGIDHDDKSIEREIAERFDHRDRERGVVELPEHHVIALMLREGFARGKGKQPTANQIRNSLPFKVEEARAYKARLLAESKGRLTEKAAHRQAVEWLSQNSNQSIDAAKRLLREPRSAK
jgi:hypothetical protein